MDLKPLNINVCDLKFLARKADEMKHKELRIDLLKKTNFTCQYCGGNYKKFLMCIPNTKNFDKIDDIANYEITCRLCYIINHINYGFGDETIICQSNFTQKEIVRRTVDFFIQNERIPNPIELDLNVKINPLSVMELSNILIKYSFESIPNEMKNYKLFFTSNLDISFLNANLISQKSLFINENKEKLEKEEIKFKLEDIPSYIFSQNEQIFINNLKKKN
ncbi:Hypothetical protein KVN_LOCUS153 [uncultured virus]|nr:Hypothetical protein KVN_LOCUS153 [uncultured virus]